MDEYEGGNVEENTEPSQLEVNKGEVTDVCHPVKPPEGSIYQLLREVLGPAFLSFRGDGLNSGLSMPCWMYEPLSILQRSAEMFEYAELLERAALCKDRLNRLAYVTTFFVSIYSQTPNRFKINFNPILGETFEYVDNRYDDPIKYFSEQVSHHPPRTATHAENSKWIFIQNYHPTTSFYGNYVHLETNYVTFLIFKATGDKYMISHPSSKIHNIVMGSTWLEHYGQLVVEDLSDGTDCRVDFHAGSWFRGVNYEIEAEIFDSQWNKVIQLNGAWNSHVSAEWISDTEDFPSGTQLTLWINDEEDWSLKPYRLTDYSLSFNYLSKEMKSIILPTDSRRRLDIRYLIKGEDKRATAWKKVKENKQREEEKIRKANSPEGEASWTPVWFKDSLSPTGEPFWVFNNEFWLDREKREKARSEGLPVQLHYASAIRDTASDFTCYKCLYSGQIDSYLGEIRQTEKRLNSEVLPTEQELKDLELELAKQEQEAEGQSS
eukprot:TRINITY_DN2226_c0_g2_i4.p1 TRINITY_DN2226_c0_g2~~TRINITY_DN2226_c0_g2_i4.p1  ORF type:complete len:492 (-),score=85.87 TRINITY_DN2226_c0_g2_i4:109-1584(-)